MPGEINSDNPEKAAEIFQLVVKKPGVCCKTMDEYYSTAVFRPAASVIDFTAVRFNVIQSYSHEDNFINLRVLYQYYYSDIIKIF